MAKKNRKPRKIFDQIEPFEPQAKSTESDLTASQSEAVLSGINPEDVESLEASSETADGSAEKTEPTPSETPDTAPRIEEESPEDALLQDVRQSLIEEESLEKEKQPKWWRRISKGLKKGKTAKRVEPISEAEIELPLDESPVDQVEEQTENKGSEEYLEQIDELIGMLEPEPKLEVSPPKLEEEATAAPATVEPVQKVDIENLKKQAFQPRQAEAEAETISEVRAVALEGEEEAFVEVEAQKEDLLEDRLKAFENAIKPYRRYINITFAFLGAVMAVIAGLLVFNIYQQMRPVPTPPAVSNLPYPTSVSLPGGWSFNLGKGVLQDGQWNPQGAEWLEGTEVCRWVALPWSLQLEAVIRTLHSNDPIELTMSNHDRLVYKVYSIRQLTPEEMLEIDSNSPCLLLVLAQADSDSRWVLTALP